MDYENLKIFHKNKKRNFLEMNSSGIISTTISTSRNKKIKLKSEEFKEVNVFSPDDDKSFVNKNNNITQRSIGIPFIKKGRSLTCRKKFSCNTDNLIFYTSKQKQIQKIKPNYNSEFKIEDNNINKKKKM